MIIAIIIGSMDDHRFPGRNTFSLVGRPMATYPILAARHAKNVDRVFVSTDAPAIARIASYNGAETIDRPPEIIGPGVSLESILNHAYRTALDQVGQPIEAVVVLLANSPTVLSQMIDQGVAELRKTPALDGVVAVSLRNEFNPANATTIDRSGLLIAHPASVMPVNELSADAYFDASVLWVVRPRCLTSEKGAHQLRPNAIINPLVQRIHPMIFEGHGDVDYAWQVPGVADWLRHRGFSEEMTPYDELKQVDTPSMSLPGADTGTRVGGRPLARHVLITTVPFAEADRRPLDLLHAAGIDPVINPLNRKLKEMELMEMAKDVEVIIAGTEPISRHVMEGAPHLRLISRVGVGLDNVDLNAARERGIHVSYTPEAPAAAVGELTIGLMIALQRGISQSDRNMRQGVWHRLFGRRLEKSVVGLIGVGRIGKRVVRHLSGFSPKRILLNDLKMDSGLDGSIPIEWVDKETLYKESDVLSIHVPLTSETRNLITARELDLMKPTAVLINTARGGIINEKDLAHALRSRRIAGAALDTFLQEPYDGELTTIENCLLTSHMGSMSVDCRCKMELEATQEAIRFIEGDRFMSAVPEQEYEMQRRCQSID